MNFQTIPDFFQTFHILQTCRHHGQPLRTVRVCGRPQFIIVLNSKGICARVSCPSWVSRGLPPLITVRIQMNLPSKIGFASSICCSIHECLPLIAAKYCKINLVLSVFPAPLSPLRHHNKINKKCRYIIASTQQNKSKM